MVLISVLTALTVCRHNTTQFIQKPEHDKQINKITSMQKMMWINYWASAGKMVTQFEAGKEMPKLN